MVLSLREMPLPLVLRPPVPMSDEALLRFCEANQDYRIEREPDGEILVMTPANGETSQKNAYIVLELGLWARSNGSGTFFGPDGGFTLPDGSMRSPDAAWLSSPRWQALSREQRRKFLPLCPEFVVELRSPSDSVVDLEEKMQSWMDNGAKLGWLIDPDRLLVVVYRSGHEPEVLQSPEALEGEGPVAGFRLAMHPVWE
jgi:Uma2 family endonuclease